MKKLIIVFLALFLFLALALFLKLSNFYQGIYTPSLVQILHPKTEFNFLLLGYSGGNHDGAYLTDTMMVFHLDIKNKKADLISLPRDMWIKIPTKSGAEFHAKINSLYETELFPQDFPDVDESHFGTPQDASFAKYMVGQITGLPIDYYAAIDFEGFKKAIDILGGVDINVARNFDDYQYPIDGKEKDLCGRDADFAKIEPFLNNQSATATQAAFFKDHPDLEKFFNDITNKPEEAFPCRYEHLHFDKGPTHMDGETALKYVRSRHSLEDGGDFGRAQRQQLLLSAIKDKILTLTVLPKIFPLIDEMQKYIKTDISLNDLKKFIAQLPAANQYQIKTIVPTDQKELKDDVSGDGQFILIPQEGLDKWTIFQSWIKDEIEGITPTPLPTLKIKSP